MTILFAESAACTGRKARRQLVRTRLFIIRDYILRKSCEHRTDRD